MDNTEYGYNVKIFQYADGAQVRRYKQPIKKLTEEEKERRRKRREELAAEKKRTVDEPDGNPFYAGKTWLFDTPQPDVERSAQSSTARTKNTIYQVARANKWDLFVTLTFDPLVVDSKDYAAVTDVLANWIGNIKKRECPELAYILVPELHKSGRYHFHGLFKNIEGLQLADSGHRTSQDAVIYSIASYNLGFTTATRVMDSAKACGYFTKYITKDLCAVTKGKKRYWVSRNVARPDETAYELSVQEFNDNLMEPYDEFLATSKSITISDGVSELNHISYYEFSDHKI